MTAARSPLIVIALVALAGCDGPPPPVRQRAALVGHTREVSSIAFSPDGKALASRGGDAVRVWDVATLRETARFESDGSDMGSVAYSPDGSALAATLPGKGAVAWDLASKRARMTYLHPARPRGLSSDSVSYGWGLAYSPDGKALAGGGANGGEGGFVTLWDAATGVGTDLNLGGGPVTSVAIAPDGRTLAAKGLSDSVVLWDLETRAERRAIRAGRSFGAPVAFSPGGKALASAGEDHRVRLWDVATGAEVANLKWHLKAVLSVAFHPGGKLLASGDSGGVVLLWDLTTRSPIARFEGPQGKVWSLAFSPDGKVLASGGEDRIVRTWDVGEASGGR